MYALFWEFLSIFSLMALMHVILKIGALMKNSKKIEQKMRTLMTLNLRIYLQLIIFALLYLTTPEHHGKMIRTYL